MLEVLGVDRIRRKLLIDSSRGMGLELVQDLKSGVSHSKASINICATTVRVIDCTVNDQERTNTAACWRFFRQLFGRDVVGLRLNPSDTRKPRSPTRLSEGTRLRHDSPNGEQYHNRCNALCSISC